MQVNARSQLPGREVDNVSFLGHSMLRNGLFLFLLSHLRWTDFVVMDKRPSPERFFFSVARDVFLPDYLHEEAYVS